MKLKSLGLAFTLIVCLCVPARAEELAGEALKYGPPAPVNLGAKAAIGTEVPQMGALAQKTGFSLAALTLLFLVATGTIKRFSAKKGGTNSGQQIEVLARKNLGPRQALLVVAFGGRKFFIAQGTETTSLLSELHEELTFPDELGASMESIDLLESKSANFRS